MSSLRSLAATLITARSSLDCYKQDSVHCIVCRSGLELPIILARAADVAAADGNEDMAQSLIAKAYYVAELLLPEAPLRPASAHSALATGTEWICEGAARAADLSQHEPKCSVAIGMPSGYAGR